MFRRSKFGKDFTNLPIEIQKEIFLQNTSYYQQIIANLLIKYNKLSNEYNFVKRQLQEEQSPYSIMNHYLNIYENKNGIYSNKQRYEAYDILQSQYYPVIKIYREKIIKLKKEIDTIVTNIQNNKKKYYYFYSKFKKLV